jgi:ATP-dependent phosphoenolpyruvate carboxykinase
MKDGVSALWKHNMQKNVSIEKAQGNLDFYVGDLICGPDTSDWIRGALKTTLYWDSKAKKHLLYRNPADVMKDCEFLLDVMNLVIKSPIVKKALVTKVPVSRRDYI